MDDTSYAIRMQNFLAVLNPEPRPFTKMLDEAYDMFKGHIIQSLALKYPERISLKDYGDSDLGPLTYGITTLFNDGSALILGFIGNNNLELYTMIYDHTIKMPKRIRMYAQLLMSLGIDEDSIIERLGKDLEDSEDMPAPGGLGTATDGR